MTDFDKVLGILAAYLDRANFERQPDIYVSNEARAAPAVETWERTIEPPQGADRNAALTVAFIDLVPDANYEHPVQYAFIDEESGDVRVVEATTPPNRLAADFRKIELAVPKAGTE